MYSSSILPYFRRNQSINLSVGFSFYFCPVLLQIHLPLFFPSIPLCMFHIGRMTPPPFYNRKMFIINDYQPLSKSRTTKREHFPCVTIASLNCSLVGTSLFGPFSSFTEGSSSMWLVGGVSSFNERKYLKINSMTKISLSHFWKPGWPLKKNTPKWGCLSEP